MGLFADKAREIKKQNEGKFQPLELIEGNVQAIFNRCLAKPDFKEMKSYAQVLKPSLAGKSSDEKMFMKQAIRDNSKSISYLLGQLKSVHMKETYLPLEYGIVTYLDTHWTKQAEILFMLYELGISNGNIRPFVARGDSKDLLLTNITALRPTLSPKDPNFSAWWEAHKGEWEA